MRPTNTKTTKDPTFTGVPNTDKENIIAMGNTVRQPSAARAWAG